MFSREEKQKIAMAIERVLLEINHPEMPSNNPYFKLHVKGKETWSWADIEPNWLYNKIPAKTSYWNENARSLIKFKK